MCSFYFVREYFLHFFDVIQKKINIRGTCFSHIDMALLLFVQKQFQTGFRLFLYSFTIRTGPSNPELTNGESSLVK